MLWKIPSLKASQNKGIVFAVPDEEMSFYTLPLLVLSVSNINYSIEGLLELGTGYDVNTIVLPNDLLEKTLLYDAKQSGFWRPENLGLGNISISFTGLNEEESYSVEVDEGTFSTWRLVHEFESQKDWSKYDSLTIRWRGNNTGAKLAIVVYTGVGDDASIFLSNFWDAQDGWIDLKKPLKDFRVINGLPDWSAVKRIEVRMYTSNITGKWGISSINTESPQLELTKEKEKQIMDWVQKGGHLVVFNSNGGGLFAKQLKIQNVGKKNTVNGIHGRNTISLNEFNIFEIEFPSEFIILSHYVYKGEVIAPFIGKMMIGDGMITYIHSVPLFDSLSSIDPQLLSQLLRVIALDADLCHTNNDGSP